MQTDIRNEISLTGSIAVPGLVFRRFRGPEDIPALTAANNASGAADGREWEESPEVLAMFFEHPENWDPARDLLIAEIDGALIGYVRGDWRREETGTYRYSIELVLVPEWRGHGLRRAMLRWVEARLREVAVAHPADAPKLFAASASQHAADRIALLESEGYQVTRYFNVMVRDLNEPIPDFPLPPGLVLRPVLPEHIRLIWDATHESFRDHWGYSPWPDSWYELWRSDPATFQPHLWQVAWDVEKDEIAGEVQTFIDATENEKFNRLRGYTETIGVRRPYRRRGLARAMIAASLRTLKSQGLTQAALNVDSENLSGATRLYAECGFVNESYWISYRKDLNRLDGT